MKKRYILLIVLVFLLITGFIISESVMKNDPIPGLIDHQVQAGDISVHYVHIGDTSKPLLLMVHGSPGSWTAYNTYLATDSLREYYQLAAIDRAGYGGTDKNNPHSSLALHARCVKAVIDDINPSQPVVLMGHSFGGPVIGRTAMDYPEDISGLIYVAGVLDPEMERRRWYNKVASAKAFRWFIPKNMLVSNDEIVPLKGELEQILPFWPKITAHTVIIQGGKDGIVFPGNAPFIEKMSSSAASVDLQMYPKENHFILWSRKEVIHAAILKVHGLITK